MRSAIVAIVFVALVLAAIFALARQDKEATGRLAWRVERLLVRLVPPTGTGGIGEPTWCGLTIRRLAHVAEYAALGLCAGVATALVWQPGPRAAVLAFSACVFVSLVDEGHKHFIPDRHPDPRDLLLDALGSLPAVLVATLTCWLAPS